MFVKICGLRTPADVEVAVEAGADAIGFVIADSVRYVDPAQVAVLTAAVPRHIVTVGVFVESNTDIVRELAEQAQVQAVQLHGDHPASAFAALNGTGLRLIRATSARRLAELSTDTEYTVGAFGEAMLLLDSPVPGSGHTWDPAEAPHVTGPWLLAGGLTPHNVTDAVRALTPFGVDVSSGVESTRGVKDHAKIRDFIAAARAS